MTSTLGAIYLDLTSVLLGTGYDRFSSPTGIQGLAKQDGSRLDLLAIDASDPGKGQFREFMRQAKSEFEQILHLGGLESTPQGDPCPVWFQAGSRVLRRGNVDWVLVAGGLAWWTGQNTDPDASRIG